MEASMHSLGWLKPTQPFSGGSAVGWTASGSDFLGATRMNKLFLIALLLRALPVFGQDAGPSMDETVLYLMNHIKTVSFAWNAGGDQPVWEEDHYYIYTLNEVNGVSIGHNHAHRKPNGEGAKTYGVTIRSERHVQNSTQTETLDLPFAALDPSRLSVEHGQHSDNYLLTLHYRKTGGGEGDFYIAFTDPDEGRRVAKAFAHAAQLVGAKSDPFN
jgi:hypothetical protein